MENKPNYIAKHSAWSAVTFWRIILSPLIIPLIIMIFDIIAQKHNTIEFYEDFIIQKSGILSKKEKRSTFSGVVGVSVNQTIWQRICHYGNVAIDLIGKSDINTENLANPYGLKEYLETKLIKSNQTNNVFMN